MTPEVVHSGPIAEGRVISVGTLTVTADEIVAFARQFDPQPFHLDPVEAKESMFGELVASGFHTLAACFGLQVRSKVFAGINLGGRGIERLEWRRPVRPDQPYHLTLEIGRVDPVPDRACANVAVDYVLRDAGGEVVMRAVLLHVMRHGTRD